MASSNTMFLKKQNSGNTAMPFLSDKMLIEHDIFSWWKKKYKENI